MNFELTQEQKKVQKTAKDFAQNELWPITRELEAGGKVPHHVQKRMGELGFIGLVASSEYGGNSIGAVAHALAEEEIGWADIGIATTLSNSTLLVDILINDCTDEQRAKWLPRLINGEIIGCFCLTEPDAGSDATRMRTAAVLDGDEWVINGSKIFITHGLSSDFCFIFCMTDRSKGNRGISCFVCDKDTPGLSVGKKEVKMGIHSSDTTELVFDNLRLPKDSLVGEINKGIYICLRSLDSAKVAIGALSVGLARHSFELALEYSKQTMSRGEPLANNQTIHFKLAEMATMIDAARLMVLEAAFIKQQGVRFTVEAAKAKMYAAEVSRDVVYEAQQILGWAGYTQEYQLERFYRDQRILEIWEGTSEINRLVIARRGLGLG
jgi:alkylation response protein AidB-like acyl-CoA dehydrogenase